MASQKIPIRDEYGKGVQQLDTALLPLYVETAPLASASRGYASGKAGH